MKQGTVVLAAALVALVSAAGCSTARTAGQKWEQQDMLQLAEVVATAEWPDMAVAEVAIKAEGPALMVDEVVARAKRVPVEVTDFGASRGFVN